MMPIPLDRDHQPAVQPAALPLPDRIVTLITQGHLSHGDRLPAERQLAAKLGVSRSSLREAIKQLASQGILVSQQGGGTFVATPQERRPIRDALLNIVPFAQEDAGYWRDVMEIRTSLEGDTAALAASRADSHDKQRIRRAFDALTSALMKKTVVDSSANGSSSIARLDAGFHMSIAQAAHNAVLCQVMTGLESLLETSISDSLIKLYLLPGIATELISQHQNILDAILSGHAQQARKAATEHLHFVERKLSTLEDDVLRHKRATSAFEKILNTKDTLP